MIAINAGGAEIADPFEIWGELGHIRAEFGDHRVAAFVRRGGVQEMRCLGQGRARIAVRPEDRGNALRRDIIELVCVAGGAK